MKYVIIYWSRYGNGKKVVTHLSEILKNNGSEVELHTLDQVNPEQMPPADIYIFSAPAEAFSIQRDMKRFMKNLSGMEQRKYALINTHGMKRSWLNTMEKILNKKNMNKIGAIDFQVGKDAEAGDALPEGWQTEIENFSQQLK